MGQVHFGIEQEENHQVLQHMVSWALGATKGVQTPKQNQGLPFQPLLQYTKYFLLLQTLRFVATVFKLSQYMGEVIV